MINEKLSSISREKVELEDLHIGIVVLNLLLLNRNLLTSYFIVDCDDEEYGDTDEDRDDEEEGDSDEQDEDGTDASEQATRNVAAEQATIAP
ncbi:hypothetical protein CTI12_AA353970 [Artemisia annua]|uniref:Uncharacterized protein n=1 Tax=Artemisia annua TaxID=35608 RepID=A0A2U1M5U6_ARTAN|nr:hypothetical protein CTI12_AA353970 [Artemisia annua]